jgi:hypothetical protein
MRPISVTENFENPFATSSVIFAMAFDSPTNSPRNPVLPGWLHDSYFPPPQVTRSPSISRPPNKEYFTPAQKSEPVEVETLKKRPRWVFRSCLIRCHCSSSQDRCSKRTHTWRTPRPRDQFV